jgi:transcriptional regulator with XRE-family HTH domain
MDVLERFGQRLRQKRTALGLSQERFADKAKLDRTYVSGIERGKRNVALRNIEAIAKALGISIAELMEGVSGERGQDRHERERRHPWKRQPARIGSVAKGAGIAKGANDAIEVDQQATRDGPDSVVHPSA